MYKSTFCLLVILTSVQAGAELTGNRSIVASDGRHIVTYEKGGGNLTVARTIDLPLVETFTIEGAKISNVVLSDDGFYIAVFYDKEVDGAWVSFVRLLRADGKALATYNRDARAEAIDFTSDDRFLYLGLNPRSVTKVDLNHKDLYRSFYPVRALPLDIGVEATEKGYRGFFEVNATSGTIVRSFEVLRTKTGTSYRHLQTLKSGDRNRFLDKLFSPSGEFFTTLDSAGNYILLDAVENKVIKRGKTGIKPWYGTDVRKPFYSSDGQFVFLDTAYSFTRLSLKGREDLEIPGCKDRVGLADYHAVSEKKDFMIVCHGLKKGKYGVYRYPFSPSDLMHVMDRETQMHFEFLPDSSHWMGRSQDSVRVHETGTGRLVYQRPVDVYSRIEATRDSRWVISFYKSKSQKGMTLETLNLKTKQNARLPFPDVEKLYTLNRYIHLGDNSSNKALIVVPKDYTSIDRIWKLDLGISSLEPISTEHQFIRTWTHKGQSFYMIRKRIKRNLFQYEVKRL